MPTAMMQFHERIASKAIRWIAIPAMGIFTAYMVFGRLVSGVHWLTDIVGGILLCGGLVILYDAFCHLVSQK